MKDRFREIKLSPKNKDKLLTINDIIEEYQADNHIMTLRQLYYQLVSRDIIPNKQAEYSKISTLLKEGRLSGVVDWGAIEDRLRTPRIPYCNDSPEEAVEDTIRQYRLDRQEGQDTYLEVWVEKDALSGVLRRITDRYHVRLLVNRGYGSVTAMHDAYERISRQIDMGKDCKILYLGDHDPSGIDMIRDIRERISEMLEAKWYYEGFEVIAIGLTMDQIRMYNPPKNPAKLTDPRAKWYIERYGDSSWEVDALKPQILNQLLSSNIERHIDMDLYNQVLEQEKLDKETLRELQEKI